MVAGGDDRQHDHRRIQRPGHPPPERPRVARRRRSRRRAPSPRAARARRRPDSRGPRDRTPDAPGRRLRAAAAPSGRIGEPRARSRSSPESRCGRRGTPAASDDRARGRTRPSARSGRRSRRPSSAVQEPRHAKNRRLECGLPFEVGESLPRHDLARVLERERPVRPLHVAKQLVGVDAGDRDRDLRQALMPGGELPHDRDTTERADLRLACARRVRGRRRRDDAVRARPRPRRLARHSDGCAVASSTASATCRAGSTGIERRLSTAGETAARLDRARGELQESLATAAVLSAAFGEARAVVGRVTGLDAAQVVRVAAVDTGTNSTRLLVADVDGDHVEALVRRATVTRLGEGVDANRRLAPAAVARVHAVLAEYAAEIESARRRANARGRHERAARRRRRRGLPARPGDAVRLGDAPAFRRGRGRADPPRRRRGRRADARARRRRRLDRADGRRVPAKPRRRLGASDRAVPPHRPAERGGARGGGRLRAQLCCPTSTSTPRSASPERWPSSRRSSAT